ncbi:GNAT family N-acetyltransferase [Candidatus Roizmanbacteria bacterium]|nr:GNAT family N-acetyltransferase [Candidatus Roizmanbacteria bacterium]
MNIDIRLAKSEDKKAVLKLLDELGEEVNRKSDYSPQNTEAQKVGGPIFDEIISRKDTFIFLAEENDLIVGLITFYLLPNMRHGWHRGHVEDLVVSEKKRGQGVGSLLFNAIKNYCREHNIKVIKIDSGLDLTDAHKFYEKHGGKFTEKMFRFDIIFI